MAFVNAIALTGSIGTGKSTVCSLLKLHGYTIIDLDKISHQVIETVHKELIDLFGDSIISDNKVDRKILGQIVFQNKKKLEDLEELIHPLIKKEVTLKSQSLDKLGVNYFIDIPLFFEKESSYQIGKSVVVYCPKETQIQRVMKRDSMEYNEALNRVEIQLDIEEKKKRATFLIDNSKNIGSLTENVNSFVAKIKESK
ncbi:MAG: dephospho-CoA kinase [Campylobacterales bacterium]|nr:dephospho-CoA kinase [Campylobacterales bacterium]